MIAEQTTRIEVQSTVRGNEIKMDIASGMIAHIMDVLTNLYSDRMMAVLREYSTNARDAHIEAGVLDRPIEVTLPSPLAPFLKVKDFGVGLSEQDIAEVYSQYGASTKRETNDQTGMLGLGSKSALTYSSQFSIVSVKDHVRATVSVSRNSDGIASMTVVESIPTVEDNGTEVVIPWGRNDRNDIEQKAKFLFRYWNEGTVLVNGKPPAELEALEIASGDEDVFTLEDDEEVLIRVDRLLLCEDDELNSQNLIVMGGVPYPITYPLSLDINVSTKHHIVAFVNIGSVRPAPSREGMMDTPKTKATMKFVADVWQAYIGDAIQKAIDSASYPREAMRYAAQWREAIPGLNKDQRFLFQGEEIPIYFDAPRIPGKLMNRETDELEDAMVIHRFMLTNRTGTPMKAVNRENRVYAGTAMNALWIHGDVPTAFTSGHKKKIKLYCEQNEIDAYTFILHPIAPDSKWIDSSLVVPWDTIKALKLPVNRSASYNGSAAGTYDCYLPDPHGYSSGFSAKDIDTSNPIFYVNTTCDKGDYEIVLRKEFPDCTVVELTGNRVNKFRRDFPSAEDWTAPINRLLSDLMRKIPKQSLITHSLVDDSYALRDFKRFDPSRIEDPEFKYLIKVAEGKVKLSDKVRKRIKRADKLSMMVYKGSIVKHNKQNLAARLRDRYPLLETHSYNNAHPHEHNYIYVNAVYTASKES